LFFPQDVKEEYKPTSPLSSPPHSSTTKESVTDVSGRPSPVSVLDTPFFEDDVQPGKHSCNKAMKGFMTLFLNS